MERKNKIGTVRVHENVLGHLVLRALQTSEGRAFAASERGKLLTGLAGRPTAGEVGDNLWIREEEGRVCLTCYIILSFGAGVKRTTDGLLDEMQRDMQALFPDQSGRITLHVVGVKSRQIAERDIEVKREWDCVIRSQA